MKPVLVKRAFIREWRANSAIPKNIRAERILKGWEQFIPETVKRISPDIVRQLLASYRSLITTFRIGVVEEIGNVIATEIENHIVEIKAATVVAIEVAPEGQGLNVLFKGQSKFQHFHWVINSIGRETDYTKLRDPLWIKLLSKRIASRHRLTDIGVEVDWQGMLVGPNAESCSTWISAAGVMCEGAEFERNGRLGSFSFTIGPIKNQALAGAWRCLRRISPSSNVARLVATNRVQFAAVQDNLNQLMLQSDSTTGPAHWDPAFYDCLLELVLSRALSIVFGKNSLEPQSVSSNSVF